MSYDLNKYNSTMLFKNQDDILNIILDQSHIGLWDWNFKTNRIQISNSMKTMLGYSVKEIPDEIDYEFLLKVIYPDDIVLLTNAMQLHFESKGVCPYKLIVRYFHKNGSLTWIMCRGKVIEWSEAGEAVRMVGSHIDINEQIQLQVETQKSLALLNTVINNIPESIFWKDADRVYKGCNKAFADFKGFNSVNEVVGKTIYEFPFQSCEDSDAATKDDKEVIVTALPKLKYIEYGLAKDNKKMFLETSKVPLLDDNGNPYGLVGIINNVTRQQEIQKELVRSSKLYHILSHINKLLLNLGTQQQYFEDICDAITEIGGFKLAWIGMLEGTVVNIMGFSGSSTDYLMSLNVSVSIDETSNGFGPTGRCVNARKRYICNNFLTDPATISWRENALKHGIRSSAAFPIILKGKAVGALTVYEGIEDYFNTKEIELIEEVVLTIALGLEMLEQAAKKKIADQRIKQLADIMQHSNAFIGISNLEGILVYLNNSNIKIFGIDESDIGKVRITDFLTEKSKYIYNNYITVEVLKNGIWSGELEWVSRTGNLIPVIIVVVLHRNEAGEPELTSATAIDITELKNKEKELEKLSAELRSLSQHQIFLKEEERKSIAKDIHFDLGQNLAAIKIGISWLIAHSKDNTSVLINKMEELKVIATETVQSSRRLYNSIYPQMLEDVGLTSTIKWHFQSYLNNKGNKLKVNFKTNLPEGYLFQENSDICLTLFRAYQECFGNILRYADARIVTILLEKKENIIKLIIKDDGVGFEPGKVDTKKHHGLLEIKERIVVSGGTLLVQSHKGKGTTIEILLQIPEEVE